jgi:hypothetical protein
MSVTAAGRLIDVLMEWGVEVIFGLPGDGINGIMEALRTRQEQIRFVQVRHEEAAAFMACGYAKFTGRIGVCLPLSRSRRLRAASATTFRRWRVAVPSGKSSIEKSNSSTRQKRWSPVNTGGGDPKRRGCPSPT